MIVDGADNFPTRYLLNDASVWHDIPVVHGSIYRFEGQTTVFKPGEGPCYRCLFPEPPPPELAPSCAEGGVLGVLPGIVGSLQASEALKLLLGIGEPARRPAAPLRRARDDLHRDHAPPGPRLPGLRREPDDHRVRRLRRVLRRPTHARMTRVRIPPTLRAEVGGQREVEASGSTLREVIARPRRPLPGARAPGARGRRDRAVRERLREQRGRPDAPGPRHAGRRGLDRDPAPGDGRRRARARGRAVAPRRGRTARRSSSCPRTRAARRRAALREARGPEPDRLDQGPRREGDGRGRGGARRARARPRAPRADERQHGHLARARGEAQGLRAHVRRPGERDARAAAAARALRRDDRDLARLAGLERRRPRWPSAWPSATRAT